MRPRTSVRSSALPFSRRAFSCYGGVTLAGDGGGQTWHSWGQAALELAARGYFVAVLDLRGHGDYDWAPNGDYGIDAQVSDIRAVICEKPTPVPHAA